MIERHVTFFVHPGKELDFENFFKEAYEPAMVEMPGFINANLLRDQEHTSNMKMVLRFETLESAAVWRASKAHEELKPSLKSHYEGSELLVYDVLV
jgi:heme-degrading monooxygenase HmoA